MRALLVFLLFLVYALFVRWYYVCQYLDMCNEVEEVEDVRLQTLQFTEGDSTIYSGFDQFKFDTMAVRPILNENNRLFLDTVAAYLNADTLKKLTITSFYRESEKGEEYGMYENLGVARAAEIRKLLVRRGIAENRISLDYGLSEDEYLLEPLQFDGFIIPDEFETVQFTFTNMTFSDANFEYGSDVFRPGTPFLSYADSVKTFLELNPNNRLTVIGHTDNKGTEKFNYRLGLRRANSAKEYFQEMGIDPEKIEIESQGEKQPVAPNTRNGRDYPDGRQKNRRVNFVLQKSN